MTEKNIKKILAFERPDLIKEWDFEKNANICTPDEVTVGSNKKVWWKCNRGHNWEADINSRNNGTNCPYCSNRKVLKGFNDLATTNPELAKEWHSTNNGNLTPEMVSAGSGKKVWWKCRECGNEWMATVSSRNSRRRGCPKCSKKHIAEKIRKIRAIKNNLATNHPELVKEWDFNKNVLLPSNYACGSDKKAWWVCSWCGNSWQTQINYRALGGSGCPKCRKQSTSFPEQAIFYYCNKYFNNVTNRDSSNGFEIDVLIKEYNVAIEYDGVRWHNSEEAYKKDNIKDEKCHKKNLQIIRFRDCSLNNTKYAKIIPCKDGNISELENGIKELLKFVNNEKVYDVNIKRDTVNIISQYENNKIENSLAYKYPELAKEWNYEKNGQLTPNKVPYGYGKSVWWTCKMCGNDFQMTPNKRTNRGSGCPKCSRKKAAEQNYIQIINLDTLEVFDSLIDAAKSYGGRPNNICKCCNGKQKTAFGFRWAYVDEKKRRRKHFKGKIRCIETGIVFENDKEAAKWCEGDNRNINAVCNGRENTYKGYHWEYVDQDKDN